MVLGNRVPSCAVEVRRIACNAMLAFRGREQRSELRETIAHEARRPDSQCARDGRSRGVHLGECQTCTSSPLESCSQVHDSARRSVENAARDIVKNAGVEEVADPRLAFGGQAGLETIEIVARAP